MEFNKWIADLEVGDEIEGFYILKTAQIKTSNSGKPFLASSVADRSGAIDAKLWDYGGPLGAQDEGSVVKLRGSVSEYRGTLQLILSRIRPVQADDRYNLSELVPTAPIDAGAAWQELLEMTESIQDPDYRAVCRTILDKNSTRFQMLPGGKSVHHSFINGLLMHTLYMARTAEYLAGLYQDIIDRDLLLAGTILHDVAKCREFVTSPLGLVTEYSVPGELLGHLVMGAQAVADAARELDVPEEKSMLLQHLLLSHHGEPEFGSAVRPMCAESELLSLIDLVDSRMEIYKEAMEETETGRFSKRIFALDKKVYRHR
ncbi:MAG: HD domain-containing protein [Oscillospiraceae bacterium]|nr:HD domain-containing protein [Oscillospiraceae bacterium]